MKLKGPAVLAVPPMTPVADESIARATVVLKSKDGARLWGGDFQPRHPFKTMFTSA